MLGLKMYASIPGLSAFLTLSCPPQKTFFKEFISSLKVEKLYAIPYLAKVSQKGRLTEDKHSMHSHALGAGEISSCGALLPDTFLFLSTQSSVSIKTGPFLIYFIII